MAVEILRCPACCAPLQPGDSRCRACGVPFVTIPCVRCGKPTLLGAPRCHLCGAETLQAGQGPSTLGPCPGCEQPLRAFRMGEHTLAGCPSCHGIWMEGRFMARLCAQAQVRDALAERLAASPTPVASGGPVTFRRCPACAKRMPRIVFGRTSGVTLDACRDHGVFFDAGELERILAFLRQLPLDAARAALQGLRVPGPDHAVAAAGTRPDEAQQLLMGLAVGGALAILGNLFD